jgi:hypothetical protein
MLTIRGPAGNSTGPAARSLSEVYVMSATRSLLAAGALTALVVVAVLAVGARRGAFSLGTNTTAAALPAEAAIPELDAAAPASTVASVRSVWRDDDDDDEHEHEHARPAAATTDGTRALKNASRRADHDD